MLFVLNICKVLKYQVVDYQTELCYKLAPFSEPFFEN